MFVDLIQLYKVFYVLVTEILERFSGLSVDQAKKAFVVYQNFCKLTQIMKTKADVIMTEFEFHVRIPTYYTPDANLVEILKTCITEKT